jgi:hypothetical protein
MVFIFAISNIINLAWDLSNIFFIQAAENSATCHLFPPGGLFISYGYSGQLGTGSTTFLKAI